MGFWTDFQSFFNGFPKKFWTNFLRYFQNVTRKKVSQNCPKNNLFSGKNILTQNLRDKSKPKICKLFWVGLMDPTAAALRGIYNKAARSSSKFLNKDVSTPDDPLYELSGTCKFVYHICSIHNPKCSLSYKSWSLIWVLSSCNPVSLLSPRQSKHGQRSKHCGVNISLQYSHGRYFLAYKCKQIQCIFMTFVSKRDKQDEQFNGYCLNLSGCHVGYLGTKVNACS